VGGSHNSFTYSLVIQFGCFNGYLHSHKFGSDMYSFLSLFSWIYLHCFSVLPMKYLSVLHYLATNINLIKHFSISVGLIKVLNLLDDSRKFYVHVCVDVYTHVKCLHSILSKFFNV
jgi:hypothetical protein